MSDCGVCVYTDFVAAQVFIQTEHRAAKVHKCCECRADIPKGHRYQLTKMLIDGTWSAFPTCLPCAEIRKAFSCEGECVSGVFWEMMLDGGFESMTTGCLSKLATPEAKAFLLQKWNEWKFADKTR